MPPPALAHPRNHGPLTSGGAHRIDRETGRAIAIARRLGARLVWQLRRLEALDGEAAALQRGVSEALAKGAPITGAHDIGAAGLPSEAWLETFKEYNKALLGYMGERRRFAAAMKGKDAGAVADDAEAIVTALMLATPAEREEADRRLALQAKDGTPK